jgi:hypothetical protein
MTGEGATDLGLAYARNSARSASRAGFGFAPMTRLTISPFSKTYIAGIDVMPYFSAV